MRWVSPSRMKNPEWKLVVVRSPALPMKKVVSADAP
jgi:hypothetical protein